MSNLPPTSVRGAFDRLIGPQRSPHAAVRRWAVQLLEDYQPSRPAVEIEKLIAAVGLRIDPVDDPTFEGALVRHPDGSRAIRMPRPNGLLPTALRYRRRFTLAHELGHYVINDRLGIDLPFANGASDPFEESLCNLFAECVLMPSEWLGRDLRDCELSPRRLVDLASEYRVSLTAFLARVRYYYRHKGIVIVLWTKRKGVIRPHWAGPRAFARAVLPHSSRSSVARAFSTPGELEGRDCLLVAGKRRTLSAVSLALGKEMVVSVGVPGPSRSLLRPVKPRLDHNQQSADKTVVQLTLLDSAPKADHWTRMWSNGTLVRIGGRTSG